MRSAKTPRAYGYAAEFGLTKSCEDQAVQQLLALQRRAAELALRDGRIPEDEIFYAEQNARLVKNAEEYYRTMFRGRVSSSNLRDRHMAETLEDLMAHLERTGGPAKVAVWEHNSHIGDARATSMGDMGEWNVGQLARERFGRDAVLLDSAPTPGPSPRHPTGTRPRSGSGWGQACKEASRPCFTRSGLPTFSSIYGPAPRQAMPSMRSASSAPSA